MNRNFSNCSNMSVPIGFLQEATACQRLLPLTSIRPVRMYCSGGVPLNMAAFPGKLINGFSYNRAFYDLQLLLQQCWQCPHGPLCSGAVLANMFSLLVPSAL